MNPISLIQILNLTLILTNSEFNTSFQYLGAVHMSRASPANRADSILSPLMGA